LYFGGISGFNEINPGKVTNNTHIKPVVITDFLLFNKSVKFASADTAEFRLDQPINITREITLDYTGYIFSFESFALSYRKREKTSTNIS